MTRLNVFFTSNLSYAQHLAVALHSLLVNNPRLPLNVSVLNSDLDPQTFASLASITKGYDCNIANTRVEDTRFEHLSLSLNYLTKETYFRLLIPQLVDSDRALHLDTDLVVNGDISSLLSLDLKNHYLAAVEDLGFARNRKPEQTINSRYFNAGVMLLNIKRWRDDNLAERIIQYAEQHGDHLLFADQCAANAVVNGDWLPLPAKFNLITTFFEQDRLDQSASIPAEELCEAKASPLIIHFTGSCKPWHLLNNHPFKHLYWKHLRQTPFKRFFSNDLNLKLFLIRLLPGNIRGFLKKLKDKLVKSLVK